ncbi:hypothetical protein MLD38_001172 [Melastoma candidum]|uniref:Uncharacterized protein n=1 Tax=Melastoma candidum TaxID=119954 RepID=A0ACB9SDZ7_9MYRT|nr:hypothetical protein MLD38_001172 [Melastoma candidum]
MAQFASRHSTGEAQAGHASRVQQKSPSLFNSSCVTCVTWEESVAMVGRKHQLLFYLLVMVVPLLALSECAAGNRRDLNWGDFPLDFVFGVSSIAYQYEGAINVDVRGMSIWDTFISDHPGRLIYC